MDRIPIIIGIRHCANHDFFLVPKNITPSVASLQRICDAFGITMSQFFAWDQNAVMDLTPQQRQLLQQWSILTPNQQELLLAFLQTIS